MNKKIIGTILALAILIYGIIELTGTGNSSLKSIGRAKAGAQNAIPAVAVLLPITGDAAIYGESARNAALLASSTLADSGQNSSPIEIRIEDTALKSSQAVSALESIRGKIAGEGKNISVVISFSSGETLALCPNTEKTKTLLLSSGSSPAITKCGPMTYSNFPNDTYQAKVLADRLADEVLNGSAGNPSKLAVLYLKNDYGQGAYDEFEKYISAKEIPASKIMAAGHIPGSSDFRTTLAKIKDLGIRNILILSQPKEASMLLKQASSLGLTFDSIYASESLKDESFVKEVPAAYKNVFLTLSPAPYSGSASENFREKYKAAYGQDPSAYADYVYDNVMLAAKVSQACNMIDMAAGADMIDGAGSADTGKTSSEETRHVDCVKNFLKEYKGIGATGSLSFGESQSPQDKEYTFYKISGDAFTGE
jgi:branched-chain amino acid transport system substrate-binding protein